MSANLQSQIAALEQSSVAQGQIILFEVSVKEDCGTLRQYTPVDDNILARRRESCSCAA